MKLTQLSLLLAATSTGVLAGGNGNNPGGNPSGNPNNDFPFVPLVWDDSAGCAFGDTSYDFCAEIEFCQHGLTFGYRLPNELDCGLHTSPIIRMMPGYKYLLVMHNTAGEPGNIHTHGLHIPGDANGDDITRYADPGSCLAYTYDVASNHQGGTMWWHAHVHFFTLRHVTGGAVGMLIMDDVPDAFPSGSDGLVAFATNPENELLLQALMRQGMVEGDETLFSNFDTEPESWTVKPDVWYRLRISAVEAEARKIDVELSSGCAGHMVANDGVWVFSSPMPQAASWTLTGASRLDLAINCEAGVHTLMVGFPGNTKKAADIFARSSGKGDPSATPFAAGGQFEPRAGTPSDYYLADLTGLGASDIDQRFSTLITDDAVNFIPFNEDVPLEVGMGLGLGYFEYDKINEWQLNFTVFHPFHLHVYHVQVIEPMGCAQHIFGEYYDVINGDFMSTTCRVRFRTADYGGRVIFHCHILEHEDANAMAWINVTNAPELDRTFQDFCPPYDPICVGEGEFCRDDNDCCDGGTGCNTIGPGNSGGVCNPFTEPFVPNHGH